MPAKTEDFQGIQLATLMLRVWSCCWDLLHDSYSGFRTRGKPPPAVCMLGSLDVPPASSCASPRSRKQVTTYEKLNISGQCPRTLSLLLQCSMSCGTCMRNTNREHINVVGFVDDQRFRHVIGCTFQAGISAQTFAALLEAEVQKMVWQCLAGFQYGNKRLLARDPAQLHVLHCYTVQKGEEVVHDEATHA